MKVVNESLGKVEVLWKGQKLGITENVDFSSDIKIEGPKIKKRKAIATIKVENIKVNNKIIKQYKFDLIQEIKDEVRRLRVSNFYNKYCVR